MDHIPPKGIFEEPRPSNLITVPCCEECRKGQHDDDEFFRLFICSLIYRSPTATRLWKNKVKPRTLKRGGKIANMITDLRATATPLVIDQNGHKSQVVKFITPQEPINRVLFRITRGLYSIARPDIDSSRFIFRVEQVSPILQVTQQLLDELDEKISNHLTRGNHMFDCWWDLSNSRPYVGQYYHIFARAAVFVVLFGEE